MSQITNQKIKEISRKIAEKFKPEKIILFGSYAWGNPTYDSDIDLFIVKQTDRQRIDRGREVQKTLWGTKMPIDVLVYTPDEVKQRLELKDFFIEDIFSKGKVLYEKQGRYS